MTIIISHILSTDVKKVENKSLECDPLSLELEESELAQKLEDIAECQAVILHNHQLMQNTKKSVLSTQNEILIQLSGLERLVQCTPQQFQASSRKCTPS